VVDPALFRVRTVSVANLSFDGPILNISSTHYYYGVADSCHPSTLINLFKLMMSNVTILNGGCVSLFPFCHNIIFENCSFVYCLNIHGGAAIRIEYPTSKKNASNHLTDPEMYYYDYLASNVTIFYSNFTNCTTKIQTSCLSRNGYSKVLKNDDAGVCLHGGGAVFISATTSYYTQPLMQPFLPFRNITLYMCKLIYCTAYVGSVADLSGVVRGGGALYACIKPDILFALTLTMCNLTNNRFFFLNVLYVQVFFFVEVAIVMVVL
jgi:hypothetical protein